MEKEKIEIVKSLAIEYNQYKPSKLQPDIKLVTGCDDDGRGVGEISL